MQDCPIGFHSADRARPPRLSRQVSQRPWRLVLAGLAAACLLMGCAAPPRVPPAAPGPPPRPRLTPQETTLEQAMRDFYGSPYRSGGASPTGVDCSGLVLAVFQRVGLALPRTAAQQFETGEPVPLEGLRFGDVVFFNRLCQTKKADPYLAGIFNPLAAQEICHNGIYLGDGRFLHASVRGVQVASLHADLWRRSYMGARRFLLPGRLSSP